MTSQRGQMNFTSTGMALLFISVFAIFLGTYLGGTLNLFPTADLNTTQSATFGRLSAMANLTQDISLGVGETSTTDEDFDTKIYKSGFATVKLLFYDLPTMVTGLLADFTKELAIPTWVIGFALACIMYPLAVLLYNVFTRSFIRL